MVIPIFLVIIAGWILKKIGIINDNFVASATKLCFTFLMPVLLFRDMATSNITELFDAKFVIYMISVNTAVFLLLWALSNLFKDNGMASAFVQGSFRGNAAIFSIAIMQNMYGVSGLASLVVAVSLPLYNIYSTIILEVKSPVRKKNMIKSSLINICKNPIIIGILCGLPFSIFNVSFPVIVSKTLNNFATIATPLALLSIGAGFNFGSSIKKIKPTIAATAFKLVGQALIFLPIAVALGFRKESLVALLTMHGAPTATSAYIMAKNMNSDADLTSNIIIITALLSCFTLAAGIFILKSFGLI